jgi:ActD protein
VTRPPVYGLMAEFDDVNDLVDAVKATRDAGYRQFDAFTPFPVHAVIEAMHEGRNRLPLVVLIGGIVGMVSGYTLAWWTSAVDYPLNVGGRPLNSWPAWIPITFETTVLFAAIATVLGMLALNGLPMPYHPVFNVPRFALSTRNRFFLCIEATDPRFDRDQTRRFLERLVPRQVSEVEH